MLFRAPFADGLEAVGYVRKHAAEWNVSSDKVGIVGFSAGGTVAAAAALRYSAESRPAFAAPIYAAASGFKDDPLPVTLRRFLPRPLRTIPWDWLATVWRFTKNGRQRTNQPSYICSPRVVTASGCGNRVCLQTIGSTACGIG